MEETLFKDRMVLEYDHIPEMFRFREDQTEQICRCIRPAIFGACPKNMILYGSSGTGKTTTVKKVFAELKEETHRIIPVFITCPTVKTKYAVLKKIYRAALSQEPPDRGVSVQHLIDSIGRTLAERDAVLLVCFDDALLLWHDHILEDVLDILLRMHEEYQGFKAGVILTVNTTNISPGVLSAASVLSSPSVRSSASELSSESVVTSASESPSVSELSSASEFSRVSALTGHHTTEQSVCTKTLDESIHAIFQPQKIRFPSYKEDEIRAIMTDLADKSLRHDVISPDIMDIIITETVHLGNLRTGIDLLKTSVEQAETKNRTAVSRADVRASLLIVRTTLPPAVTRLLDEQERQLLHAVAGIVGGTGGMKGTDGKDGPDGTEGREETEEPMISGDVYNKLFETIPVCYSFFAKRMIKFSNMGLVKLERVSMWGNSRRILLQYGAGCTGCSSGASGASGPSGASGTSGDLQNHG